VAQKGDFMKKLENNQISVWDEILAKAVGLENSSTSGLLLFHEEREDLTVTAASERPPITLYSRHRGLSVQAPTRRSGAVHISDPQPDDAARLVRSAMGERQSFPLPGAELTEGLPYDVGLQEEEAIALVSRGVEELTRLRPGVVAVARWVGFEQRVRIALPGRKTVVDTRRGARLRLEGHFVRGGVEASAVAEVALSRGRSTPDAGLVALAAEVAERVDLRLMCRSMPTAERMVVLAPGVAGVLIHEIVGHALEADHARGGAWLANTKGEVAVPELSVIDDPRRGRAAWTVDDEAQPARVTPLIWWGRVVGRLHDRRTAEQAGCRPTGHGRRASFREPVQPRMGCTFIAAGNLKPEDVLKATEEGIYVRRMEAANVNPLTGRAVFRVTDADRILHGSLREPLHPHLLVVDSASTLSRIDLIANDLRFDNCHGSCHKGGQALVTSVGAPTIRLGLVSVIS
jgi:predicted Zn-dependent protease